MEPMRPLPLLAAALLLLAGCSSPSQDPGPDPGLVTLVTDPSQGRTDPSLGEHLHDYWGRAERKTVVDAAIEVGGYTTIGGGGSAAVFLPEPGDVVPQGAAFVEATVSWADDESTNQYGAVELWVKSAADREPVSLGPAENGQTFSIPSSNERNDLPHQVLSGWEFHWRPSPSATPAGMLTRFSGTVTLKAEAVRGLDIPLYPGHPDRWGGATEVKLFEAEETTIADGDMTSPDHRCYSPCPHRLVPGDGVVIPVDADRIELRLERDAQLPTRLGVKYHDATTRDWVLAEPAEETATSRLYLIPVGRGGDGPYAKQSQWEFQLVIEEPVPDGYAAESYRVAASVHRLPA